MGHEMHMMEGFILDSFPYGESGRILRILTKEFGIMSVVATGVRELKSKMRGSMDVLQLVTFEYVEGKEVNRLTGIHEKEKFLNIFSGQFVIEKRRAISNVVNFVLRTVVGETQNEKLWDTVLGGVRKLDEKIDGDKNYFKVFEIIWLVQVLVSLGYWQEGKNDSFNEENIKYLSNQENAKLIIEEINKSIQTTHL
jgi:DNA repair protein RecO